MTLWLLADYIPPIPPHQRSWRGPVRKSAMDGAPVCLWLTKERQRQKQIPFGDDKQNG